MSGIKAELFEKLGRYEDAYGAYLKQNRLLGGHPTPIQASSPAACVAKAALDIDGLSPEGRDNHFIMCGFARSGTTLLEYVLGSHPRIEAFEEIPSFASVHHLFRPTLVEGKPLVADFAAKARETLLSRDRPPKEEGGRRYLRRQAADGSPPRRGSYASCSPRSVTFIIRHPYDVVLSCFKQAFTRERRDGQFHSLSPTRAAPTISPWANGSRPFGLQFPGGLLRPLRSAGARLQVRR